MKISAKILFVFSMGIFTVDALGATSTTISYPATVPAPPSKNINPYAAAPVSQPASQISQPSTHVAQPVSKAIIVKSSDDRIEIKLAANATTGYQWFVKHYDHNLLNLMSYHYQTSNANLVGTSGMAIFVFEVEPAFHRAPQITTVMLKYGQPWNLSVMKAHKVTVVSTGMNNMAASAALPTMPAGTAIHSHTHGTSLTPMRPMPANHYNNSPKVVPRYSTTQPVIAPVTPHPTSGQVTMPVTGNATQRVQMPKMIKDINASSTSGATGQSSQDDWVSLPTSSSTPSK